MLRYDVLLVIASWSLIVALILAVVLLGRALRRRDQRRAQAAQRYLPVRIQDQLIPYTDLTPVLAYVRTADLGFVRRTLRLTEEASFRRLAPADVVRLQQILERAYVAWVEDGCPR